MPSESQNQQMTAAIALKDPSKLNSENSGMAKMSKDELRKFAATPRKGLPKKIGGKSKLKGGNTKRMSKV